MVPNSATKIAFQDTGCVVWSLIQADEQEVEWCLWRKPADFPNPMESVWIFEAELGEDMVIVIVILQLSRLFWLYIMCVYIYIYIYTCTFVKCLKPTSKDSTK